MKRSYIVILLVIISGLTNIVVCGQNKQIGTWKSYSIYSNPPQKVIETENMVYYTSGGNLFSYDKKNDENYSYTAGNKLNDTPISNIYYNFEKKYLVICYESSNIDLLYENGTVKNMSDIKDSPLDPPLTITNVCFDGDFLYVATAFGLVKFNEPKGEVVTSGNYGRQINALCVLGNRLLVHSDGYMYWTDKNSMLKRWESFNKLYGHNDPLEIIPLSDNRILVNLNHEDIMLAIHTIDFETGGMNWNPFVSKHNTIPKYIFHGKNGEIYYIADKNLYTVDLENLDSPKEIKLSVLPEDMEWDVAGSYGGSGSIWSLTKEGLANYSVDSNGGLTVLMDRFKPDAFSVGKVRFFFPSQDGKRLYAQNSGETSYKFGGSTRGYDYAQTAGYIDLETESMKDVTAYPVECFSDETKHKQKTYGEYALAPTSIAEYPSDQDVYFLSTSNDGVYKVKDGEVEGRYDSSNSPMWNLSGNRNVINYNSFDRAGNLWASTWANNYKLSPLIILPAGKVALNPADVKKEDWIHPDLTSIDYWGGMDCKIYHCKHSNLVFILQSTREIFVCDTRGTFNDFSDDKYYLWEKVQDQDGKVYDKLMLASICEDMNGKVWIGTNSGIFEISPSNALNPKAVFTHLKVPRNDGSNLADYLLGTDLVMDISVDAANRKWVATYGSGVFLVSPSGDEIIENFTENNSPLPTNKVNCIYADKKSGVVYIGTDKGLVSYMSDATPAKDNYDDIFVYPNPVKPEYRGDVNITGLMDNSLVKIADTAGQVIVQGRSEGGRFVWNACNSAGVRVKSGVYYVLVSQNASGSSSGAVAKIMVIN